MEEQLNKEKAIKEEKPKRKKNKITKNIAIIIIIIVLICVGYYLLVNLNLGLNLDNVSKDIETFVEDDIIGTEGEVTTITESSLEDVFEISELQTADYIYNAITKVYDDDGTTLKYYVAYEGTVTAGIDFSNVLIEVNEETKKISITIPDVSIQDTVVNAGTLEYIFEKNKYDNENVYKEAYSICQADLDKKAASEVELLNMARDNAKKVIEALVTPWVEQIDSEYTIEIQ